MGDTLYIEVVVPDPHQRPPLFYNHNSYFPRVAALEGGHCIPYSLIYRKHSSFQFIFGNVENTFDVPFSFLFCMGQPGQSGRE